LGFITTVGVKRFLAMLGMTDKRVELIQKYFICHSEGACD